MPNIKSAKKRVKIIEKKTLRNNMIKSEYKTVVKKFENALNSGNVEEAKTLFSQATKKIDQACSKGVMESTKILGAKGDDNPKSQRFEQDTF